MWNYKPPVILSYEEFLTMYDIPESGSKTEQDTLYKKWLISAHDQLNSVSNGRLYADFPNLDENDAQAQKEVYIVKTCIGDWLEYMIITAKTFADQDKTINSNVPYSLKSKAIDGNVEQMRSDILIKFANTRWYKMSSSINMEQQDYLQQEDISVDEFALLVKKLKFYLLSLEGDNKMNADFQFTYNGVGTGKKILNSGDIISHSFNNNDPQPSIKGYNFEGRVSNSENANKILDPIDNIYKLINEFDANFFGGLSREQTYYAIQASGMNWSADFIYRKDFIVQFVDRDNFLKWAISLVNDNKGNNPETSAYWKTLNTTPIDVSAVVAQLKPFITAEITKQIDELPTIEVYDKTEMDTLLGDKASLSGPNRFKSNNSFEGDLTQFVGKSVDSIVAIGTSVSSYAYGPKTWDFGAISAPTNASTLTGVRDPQGPTEIANKRYVDSLVGGDVEFRVASVDVPRNTSILPRLGTGESYVSILSVNSGYNIWITQRGLNFELWYQSGAYTLGQNDMIVLIAKRKTLLREEIEGDQNE